MIVVDKALAERERSGKPIRVGLVGAGYVGKGFALQLLGGLPGLKLVAISNRTIGEAEIAVKNVQGKSFVHVSSVDQLESAIKKKDGPVAITSDAMLLCQSPSIDCIVEATGEIEFASRVALEAFKHKKYVVVLNAELDATLSSLARSLVALSSMLFPVMPGRMTDLARSFGLEAPPLLDEIVACDLAGRRVTKGAVLFPKPATPV